MLSRAQIKLILFLIGALGIVGVLYLGPVELPTLSYLQTHLREYQGLYEESPVLTFSTYFVFYVLATSASLPGALLLTLLAGALFGPIAAFFLVSFAATLGASVSFLLSRFLLSDFIRHHFAGAFIAIDEGVKRSGAFYLVSIRISPIFPYFIVNLVMGLTKMKLGVFALSSYVGLIIPTLIYVNAGREISEIHSLADVLNPSLVISLSLLALLPIAGKWVSRKFIS